MRTLAIIAAAVWTALSVAGVALADEPANSYTVDFCNGTNLPVEMAGWSYTNWGLPTDVEDFDDCGSDAGFGIGLAGERVPSGRYGIWNFVAPDDTWIGGSGSGGTVLR
jgi:hypothetical protein